VTWLIQRHKSRCLADAAEPTTASLPDVFLLTLVTSTPFYSRMGFLEVRIAFSFFGFQYLSSADARLTRTLLREVGGWGRDPKKCTGRDWGMGSSTI